MVYDASMACSADISLFRLKMKTLRHALVQVVSQSHTFFVMCLLLSRGVFKLVIIITIYTYIKIYFLIYLFFFFLLS